MTESQRSHYEIPTPESEHPVDLAILLDVDGVVTDPIQKKVTETELFDQLENQLAKGNKIALNTGRSNEWMIERVIRPLANRLADKTNLKNFFAVGEKGLTWVSFDSQGNLIQGVFDREGKLVKGFDLSVFLESDTAAHFKRLEAEVKKLINDKYSHSTFFDSSKKAMISTEMHDEYNNHSRFAREQTQFANELKDLLKREGLEGKFKVDPTTIATDIQVPQAGKHLGTKRILEWLKLQGVSPKHFIAVGDSVSDLEMADELKAQGKSYVFYYVNPDKPLPEDKIKDSGGNTLFSIKTTQGKFGNGTLEVLKNL